jgi:hypothetical protein
LFTAHAALKQPGERADQVAPRVPNGIDANDPCRSARSIASTAKAAQSSSGEKHTATAAPVPRNETGVPVETAPSASDRARPEGFYNQLLRFNLRGNQMRRWFEDGCYPGEPVFVPRPNGADRLEGVIVSVVLDGQRGRSFLLVLDAQSFEEVGRAFAPHVIPFGFHGEFKS